MDVRLRDLTCFVALSEELHLTRAAERLYVSQPALSRQLRTMERHLGFALFDRHPHGLALTAQGAALLPAARDVLERWSTGLEEARATGTSTVLVVGIQTALARDLHRTAFERFKAALPDWALSVRQVGWHDPSTGLLDGGSDVALCWLPVPSDGLSWQVLARERRFVALPAGHRLAELPEVPFLELLDEPFLALPDSAGPLRDFWLALPERQGRPAVVGGVIATADEAYEAVAVGQGVALIAEGNADLYAHPGVVCRQVLGLEPAELALVWRTRDRRPAVRAFRDCFGTAP